LQIADFQTEEGGNCGLGIAECGFFGTGGNGENGGGEVIDGGGLKVDGF
jgi:hypothetical protein